VELLALLAQLYGSLQGRFDAEDTAAVFVWVEKACRNPWSGEQRLGARLGHAFKWSPVLLSQLLLWLCSKRFESVTVYASIACVLQFALPRG
jgi:predicted neuraminidase